MTQMKARIIGTGVYIPEKILTNKTLSTMVDTSDEWIISRTGISERRINDKLENWQMAQKAVLDAIDNSHIEISSIDMIVACTATPDYFTPSLACVVQGAIGAKNAFAFDVIAGCSGFVYALDVVNCFVKCGRVKTALIVCSEILSRITDYSDRSTCVLFGDGASAVVIREDPNAGILSTFLASDGTGGNLLMSRSLSNVSVNDDETIKETIYDSRVKNLKMNGREVYKFAVKAIPEALDKTLAIANLTMNDLKYVITHQANARIIDSVIEKYNFNPDIFPVNIYKYGNTSSASIPILFNELSQDGKIQKGDKIAFVGFGAGLTYGATIVEM